MVAVPGVLSSRWSARSSARHAERSGITVIRTAEAPESVVRRLRAVAHLFAHAVEPADQLEVEVGVAAEVVVDAAAAFEQAGQDFIEVGDGIGIVHREAVDRAVVVSLTAIPFPIRDPVTGVDAGCRQYR